MDNVAEQKAMMGDIEAASRAVESCGKEADRLDREGRLLQKMREARDARESEMNAALIRCALIEVAGNVLATASAGGLSQSDLGTLQLMAREFLIQEFETATKKEKP